MALTKETTIDKIELVGPHRIIQVREAEVILEDGVEIARKLHRYTLAPDEDTENEELKTIKAAVHTPSVKANYKAFKERGKN